MLSCNSTRASICGLALSWKYRPHALGASHIIEEFGLNKIANVNTNENSSNTGKINLNIEIGKIDDSKPGKHLFLNRATKLETLEGKFKLRINIKEDSERLQFLHITI